MDNRTFSGTGTNIWSCSVSSEWTSYQAHTLCPPSVCNVSPPPQAQCIFCVLFWCGWSTWVIRGVGATLQNWQSTVRVLVYNHGAWVTDVSLHSVSTWGKLPTLCPSMWWALCMVSCDGPYELCKMGACTRAGYGSAVRDTSGHTCRISERKFCCPKITTQVQPHWQGSVTWTVQQEATVTRWSSWALWESESTRTLHVGRPRLLQVCGRVWSRPRHTKVKHCSSRRSSQLTS